MWTPCNDGDFCRVSLHTTSERQWHIEASGLLWAWRPPAWSRQRGAVALETVVDGAGAAQQEPGAAAANNRYEDNPFHHLRLAWEPAWVPPEAAPSRRARVWGAASLVGPNFAVAGAGVARCGPRRKGGTGRHHRRRRRGATVPPPRKAARRRCTARAPPLGVSAGRGGPGRAGPHRPLGGGPGHQLTGPAAALRWCRRSSLALLGSGAAPRIYSRTSPRLAGLPPSLSPSPPPPAAVMLPHLALLLLASGAALALEVSGAGGRRAGTSPPSSSASPRLCLPGAAPAARVRPQQGGAGEGRRCLSRSRAARGSFPGCRRPPAGEQ